MARITRAVKDFAKGVFRIGVRPNDTVSYRTNLSEAVYDKSTGEWVVRREKHIQYKRGGREGKRVSEFYQRFTKETESYTVFDAKEKKNVIKYRTKINWGGVVMDKDHVTRKIADYMYGEDIEGRLDKGFFGLMMRFKGRVPDEVIEELQSKWDLMDNTQKADVFEIYRKYTIDADYGSSSISSRGAGLSMDANSYADILNDAIDEVAYTDMSWGR